MNKLCEKRNIDNGFSSTESDPHSLDETIIATLLKCVRFFRLAFVATSAVTVSVTEHSSSCVKKVSPISLYLCRLRIVKVKIRTEAEAKQNFSDTGSSHACTTCTECKCSGRIFWPKYKSTSFMTLLFIVEYGLDYSVSRSEAHPSHFLFALNDVFNV